MPAAALALLLGAGAFSKGLSTFLFVLVVVALVAIGYEVYKRRSGGPRP
jgi:hypothetical protein